MRRPRAIAVFAHIAIGSIWSLGANAIAQEPDAADEPERAVAAVDADGLRFFEESVKPILETNCWSCHGGGEKTRGNLDLTTRAGALKGGDFGPAVDLEYPEASLLLEAIRYEGLEMPPSGKLAEEEIAILEEWVMTGAPAPAGDGAPAETETEPLITEEDRRFWSFQPITRPEPPEVQNEGWVRNPIDRFVLHRLEAEGLRPAPEASRIELVRRLSFDLTGLPPTPEDVDAFLEDERPDAYERLVDRLLTSPHYGERWGRRWLDIVRFAETNSFERDRRKPNSWRYRDYVIRSFNEDRPYDEFVRQQIAGDELDRVTADSVIATGFYRLGPWDDEPTDPLQARYDELDDMITTTGQAFLGLTINCARCHDHKIDPIPQADYYRFLAFFRNLKPYSYDESHILTDIATPEERAEHERLRRQRDRSVERVQERLEPLEAKVLETVPEPRRTKLVNGPFDARRHVLDEMAEQVLEPEQLERYRRLIAEYRAIPPVPPLPKALSAREFGPDAPPTHLLIRGNAHAEGDQVEPGFPQVLGAEDPVIPSADALDDSSGRRRALAEWLTDPENPLPARVMANRIWQGHFGRGIVRTPNDFGFQGARPTHPQLLDWLAATFIESGWRIKPLHRLIVTSSAYRMSSQADPSALEADPANDLLWRFDMRRLSAEEIRDALLAVNGRLNRKMGGPGFYTQIPKAYLQGQSRPGAGWGQSSETERGRRSIYIHLKRSLVTPILSSFDAAPTDTSCPVRFVTTQPTQALNTINGAFFHRQAKALARRVTAEIDKPTPEALVERTLRLVIARPPTADEIDRGRRFLEALQTEDGFSADQAFEAFCLLAVNLNEFLYLD